MSYLDKIMCPRSLAVIGASNKEHYRLRYHEAAR